MFEGLSDLFDRDGKKRSGRSTGLRGLLQRVMGSGHDSDHRRDSGRYRRDDRDDDDRFEHDDDRRYASRRRRDRDDDDDD